MKKIIVIISLFLSQFIQASNATELDGLLNEYIESVDEVPLDAQVGGVLWSAFAGEEVLNCIVESLKETASKEVLDRLKVLLSLYLRAREIEKDPEFLKQYSRAMEILNTHKDSLEGQVEAIMEEVSNQLRQECFLFVEYGAIHQELEAFNVGIEKGMQSAEMSKLLKHIIKNIDLK